MNMTAFWDVAPCSLLDTDRRFGRAYRLHHHHDDGGNKLFKTLGWYLPDYTVLHPRKQPSSFHTCTSRHENLEPFKMKVRLGLALKPWAVNDEDTKSRKDLVWETIAVFGIECVENLISSFAGLIDT
jgi:hypothetical protein